MSCVFFYFFFFLLCFFLLCILILVLIDHFISLLKIKMIRNRPIGRWSWKSPTT